MIAVYDGGSLLVSATIPNDTNYLPQGSYIGVFDNWQNGNIAIDNLTVAAA